MDKITEDDMETVYITFEHMPGTLPCQGAILAHRFVSDFSNEAAKERLSGARALLWKEGVCSPTTP